MQESIHGMNLICNYSFKPKSSRVSKQHYSQEKPGSSWGFLFTEKKKKQINKTKSVAIRYSKDNTKHLPALTWASEFRCFVFLKGDARHEVWSFSSFIVYQYKQVSTIHCHRSCSLLLNTCQYSTV